MTPNILDAGIWFVQAEEDRQKLQDCASVVAFVSCRGE